jgi:hypothetical protein
MIMRFFNSFKGWKIIFLLFISNGLFAQKVITNDEGEKIILFPDGRWELVKADSAKTPLNDSLIQEERPKKIAQYNSTTDLLLNPPPPECVYAFEGIDKFSGHKRTDLASQSFFTFTPENFREHLDGKEYISCRGNLTKISGGFVFLNLEFEIYSANAIQAFGSMPIYSQLSIKLLNGNQVRLLNKKEDFGEYNSTKKAYYFKTQYAISRKQEKALKKSELDKIRIVWGTGYEDYEIYELDFFINQFRCLEK